MKPELLDELAALVESLRGTVFTGASADSIKEALAIAKSAIPSGQVAEDAAALGDVLKRRAYGDEYGPSRDRVLSLAAQAQFAETYRANWQEAERGRVALLAECEALKKERDDYRQRMMEESGKFLAEVQRADRLQDAANRFSVSGQAPPRVDASIGATLGHIRGCPCADCVRAYPGHADAREATAEYIRTMHPSKPYTTTVGHAVTGPELLWTMRDDFAKAAMHTVVIARKGEIEEGIVKFADVARRAYRMADAMISARGTAPKVEFTREAVDGFTGCQNDRERVCYGAGYDKGLASMKGACWEAVQGQLQACGVFAGSPTWNVIKAAINGAAP